jgi:hypothetical protein
MTIGEAVTKVAIASRQAVRCIMANNLIVHEGRKDSQLFSQDVCAMEVSKPCI